MLSIFDRSFYLISNQENHISLFEKVDEFEIFQLRIGLQNLCQNTLIYPVGKNVDGQTEYKTQVSPHSKEFYSDACLQFCADSQNETKCTHMMNQITAYFCESLPASELEISEYTCYPYDETLPQKCFICYQCPFVHLYKLAFPIYVNDTVIAVLFTGQFSIAPPPKSRLTAGLTSRLSQSAPSAKSHRCFDSEIDLIDFVKSEILPIVQEFSQTAHENLFKQQTRLLLKKIETQTICMEDEITTFLTNISSTPNMEDFGKSLQRHFWDLIAQNIEPYLKTVEADKLFLFMNESSEDQSPKPIYGKELYPEIKQNCDYIFAFQKTPDTIYSNTIYSLDKEGCPTGAQIFDHLNIENVDLPLEKDALIHLEKLQPFAVVIYYSATTPFLNVAAIRRHILEHLEYFFLKVAQKLAYLSSRLSEQINKAVLRIYRHEIVHQITVLSNNNWFLDIDKLRTMDEQKLRHIAEDQRQCIFELDFMTQNINVVTGKINKQSIDIEKNQTIDVNSSIVNKAISLYQRAKRDKSLWFTVQNHSACPSIRSNQELLDMIFFNLMSNAIKYSYPGTNIIIGVEDTNHHGRPSAILLTDFGSPVEAEDHNQIFQMYFRGNSSPHIEGTGIGLYVAYEIANILDATISWESKKISDYNIPILMRYLHLPSEFQSLQATKLEQLHAEHQRLLHNNLLSRVYNKEYLKHPETWNSYEMSETLTLPTYEVTFKLEL